MASGAVGAGIYSALDDVKEAVDTRNEPLRRFEAGEATALVKNGWGRDRTTFLASILVSKVTVCISTN